MLTAVPAAGLGLCALALTVTGLAAGRTVLLVPAAALGLCCAGATAMALSRRRLADTARSRKERQRLHFVESHVAQVLADEDGTIVDLNPAACRLLGVVRDSAIGSNLDVFEHGHVRGRGADDRTSAAQSGPRRFVKADGSPIWCLVTRSPIRDDTWPGRALVALQDVTRWKKVEEALEDAHAELDRRAKQRNEDFATASRRLRREASERKALDRRLEHLALHDPLTGLANRTLLLDRLTHALRRLRRQPGRVVLLFIDLDRFKLVNDGFGHAIGDRLLVAVARRLEMALRPGDTVARLGGDEFAVLCEQSGDGPIPEDLADRVLATLASLRLEGVAVTASASAGIVTCTDPGSIAEDLLQEADMAMYEAKRRGRGQWVAFDDRMRRRAIDRLRLEGRLRRAVRSGELEVHYQPQIDLRDGRLHGVEALLRWRQANGSILPASAFIDVAEETGLISDVGTWIVDTACLDAESWRESHPDIEIGLQVNLSARQLVQPDLVRNIESSLARTGTDPSRLSFEITERVLVEDTDRILPTVRNLGALGIRIGIDDFGTRYSSLTNLKLFTLDSVKINQAFVHGLGEDTVDSEIVGAVVRLAHNLGIEVIAGGVETLGQLRALRQLDCEIAQGWLFGGAESATHIASLLSAESAHPGWLEAAATRETGEC